MDIDTTRAREIEAWIKDHPELEVKELKAPIELSGKTEYYSVWKLPIRLLVYNIRNGRFAAELLSKEHELNRKLDPTVPADAKIIQALLLNLNKKETTELKESLKEHGQLEEGIISFDGAVINANRRMAILSLLYEETSENQFEYLKVARLPKNVDEKDIWRIEAGLQFAKDLRLEYGPVNVLLKLREGVNKGLNAKQISHFLMGRYSPEEVEDRLKVLALIDSYLEAIGKPHAYDEFQEERKVEQFNSLSNNVIEPLKKREEIPKIEIPKLIEAAFVLIKSSDIDYLDIRKLRGIANNRTAKETLLKDFKPGRLKGPIPDINQQVENFNVAEEIYKSDKERDKPKQLAERALAILNSINKTSSELKKPEVQQLLQQISNVLGQLLEHSRAQ